MPRHRLGGIVLALAAALAVLASACGNNVPQGLRVGARAPEFSLPAVGGETVGLSGYHNRPVLLFFHMAQG